MGSQVLESPHITGKAVVMRISRMRKANQTKNILQVVALCLPAVAMATAGLFLSRKGQPAKTGQTARRPTAQTRVRKS